VSTVKSHRGDNTNGNTHKRQFWPQSVDGWVSTVKSHRGDNKITILALKKKCKRSVDGWVSTVKSHRGDNKFGEGTTFFLLKHSSSLFNFSIVGKVLYPRRPSELREPGFNMRRVVVFRVSQTGSIFYPRACRRTL
jgi:hypothetical protein